MIKHLYILITIVCNHVAIPSYRKSFAEQNDVLYVLIWTFYLLLMNKSTILLFIAGPKNHAESVEVSGIENASVLNTPKLEIHT